MAVPLAARSGLSWEIKLFRWLTASDRRSWTYLTLFAFITRLPLLAYPKACDDEQVYAVVALEMLHGGRPYVDAVERKPPFLFYLYEGVLALGQEYNFFLLHLAALLWTIATMAAIYFVARRLFDSTCGFVAALLYAIFSAWADYTNLAFNGELIMNLPVVLALLFAFRPTRAKLRWDLAVSGALVALGFLLKQPAATTGVPLAVYVLHPAYRESRGLSWVASVIHALTLALGFVICLGAAALFLDHQGVLGESYYWTITNHANPMGPTTWFFWHKLPLNGTFFVAETLPLLVAGAYSLHAGWRKTRWWATRRAEFAAHVVFLCVSILGVCANGQFNYHYFLQLTPALALVSAPVFAELWQKGAISQARILGPVFTARWVALSALLFLTIDTIGLSRNRGAKPAAVYVREHSNEGDRMFMWGQGTAQTGLYLDARRRPASRYIASFPLNGLIFGMLDRNHDTRYRIVPGSWDNLRQDFSRHPPRFIIDCHAVRDGTFYQINDYDFLSQLLTREFQEVYRGSDGVVYQRITPVARVSARGQAGEP